MRARPDGESAQSCRVKVRGHLLLAALAAGIVPTTLPAAPILLGQAATVYATATNPMELAFGADGSLYVGRDTNSNTYLQRVPAGGGAASSWGSRSVYDPDGLAYFDGNVYACGEGEVVSADAGTGAMSQWVALAGRNPTTMTVDVSGDYGAVGDVFVGSARHNSDIEWIPAAGRTPVTLVSSLDLFIPRGLLFASGELYCVESSETKGIWQIGPTGALRFVDDGGFSWSQPSELAYHKGEDAFYVADADRGTIHRVPRAGGLPESIGEGFGEIRGMAFGPGGYLYISDVTSDVIWRALPEPTAAGLLAVGVLLILRRSRRRPVGGRGL